MPAYGSCTYVEATRGVSQSCVQSNGSYNFASKRRRLKSFFLHVNDQDTSRIPVITDYFHQCDKIATDCNSFKRSHEDVMCQLDESSQEEHCFKDECEMNKIYLKDKLIKGISVSGNVVQNKFKRKEISSKNRTLQYHGPSTTPEGGKILPKTMFNLSGEMNLCTKVYSGNDTERHFLFSTASTTCTSLASPYPHEIKTACSQKFPVSTQETESLCEDAFQGNESLSSNRASFNGENLHTFLTGTTDNFQWTSSTERSDVKQVKKQESECATGNALELKMNQTLFFKPKTSIPINQNNECLKEYSCTQNEENRTEKEYKTSTNDKKTVVVKSVDEDDVQMTDFTIDDGYIVTPGKHRIHINNFLMDADKKMREQLRFEEPGIAAISSYSQDIFFEWRQSEKKIDKKVFQLSFKTGTDVERFRRMAVECILMYVRDSALTLATAHCSIHNVHRILLYYIQQPRSQLTANTFFGQSLWMRFGIDEQYLSFNEEDLNNIEIQCFKILEYPLTPPSSPDYLQRYLTVGGWPLTQQESYREISLYLVNLALFSRNDIDRLIGIVPSLLAAGALALGIKVISAGSDEGYEFWPQRLVVYSGYSIADLRVAVRGLSSLLRRKPVESHILEDFHPVWARYDWK
ncbi:uncharacterized protein LOC128883092 isoform X2 [Hylaeus volcanicus]|uniref:uncharacterized protein LOC128883092 isoform X2 n=1 Tax=Hylaeus volcanicus TaxID=313075 RepID=UPI0023B7D580|nr:uncharacterized protein LOC128883092 isoform X2 [Hylaeus volcanicus]